MVNVDPDVGAILSHLEYKMKERGFTHAAIQKELAWKGSLIGKLLERTKELRLDHLLQILVVMDVDPIDFFLEAYGRQHRSNKDYETELREELVRLLHENLTVFADPPPLPRRGREPLADHLQLDLELLDEPIAGARDLIAAARWMMTRLAPAERQMLVGLCERLGSFEAGIAAAKDLLSVAGSSEEAVWAMEHQSQLVCREREIGELLEEEDALNVEAIMFLIDLEIRAARRQDLYAFVLVRDQLLAIQEMSAEGKGVSTHEEK